MNPTNDLPVLDDDVLQALRDLSGSEQPDLFREVIELFREDGRVNLEKIIAALDRGDVRTLHQTAHTLKSSCAHVGAARLSAACSELELLGRTGSLAGAQALVSRIRAQFDQVSSALGALVE